MQTLKASMNTLQNGFWTGTLATGPMTLAMFALQKTLPSEEKSPLPPATLSHQTAQAVGATNLLNTERREALTMVSHFAYGIACASIYAMGKKILDKKADTSPILSGALFGAGVWTVSYLGWTPVFGFRANAFNMPAKRNALMIAAHLVWGACLGYSEHELRRRGDQLLDGKRKAPEGE